MASFTQHSIRAITSPYWIPIGYLFSLILVSLNINFFETLTMKILVFLLIGLNGTSIIQTCSKTICEHTTTNITNYCSFQKIRSLKWKEVFDQIPMYKTSDSCLIRSFHVIIFSYILLSWLSIFLGCTHTFVIIATFHTSHHLDTQRVRCRPSTHTIT